METGQPAARPSVTAWLVLGVGVLAYVLTVMQRTSFGVAGSTRRSVSRSVLARCSMFVFIQVAVYVSAQIPAGLLVDRFGSRTMIVISGLLLVAGQLLLAFATTCPRPSPPGSWSARVTRWCSLPSLP